MSERQPHMQSHEDTAGAGAILAAKVADRTRHELVTTMDRMPLRINWPTGRLRQRLGAVLLGVVIVTVIFARSWSQPTPDDLTLVNGYGGALKVSFLEDPAVAEILAKKYGLQVRIEERGSIDLACGMPFPEDTDFVWLGDSVAVAKYTNLGCTMLRADNVYNSPVVLYSWAPVVDALVEAGVAESTADGAYTIDFAQMVDLMMAGTTWADIGLTQLHGKIIVQTTDPARSNSGLLFAGMLANTLNGGDVVNTTTVGPLLPDIQTYFQRLGLMQPTSGDLFEQFLITGMGAKPIVALYESQIQEFLVNNPSYRDQIQQQVRILYPEPTVWATHPLVARSDKGDRLLSALKDHDIQRLAWEMHGQRPGVPQVVVDPDVIPIQGILRQIISVTTMPGLESMDLILAEIAAPPDSATPQSTAAPFVPVGIVMMVGRARLAIPGRRRPFPARRRMLPSRLPGRHVGAARSRHDRRSGQWSASPERLALAIDPSAEVVVSRIGINADGDKVGALIIRVTLEGYDFLVYEEYRANDEGSFAALQLLMLVDDVEPGLAAAESLSLEGGPIVTLFTTDEILSVAQATNVL